MTHRPNPGLYRPKEVVSVVLSERYLVEIEHAMAKAAQKHRRARGNSA